MKNTVSIPLDKLLEMAINSSSSYKDLKKRIEDIIELVSRDTLEDIFKDTKPAYPVQPLQPVQPAEPPQPPQRNTPHTPHTPHTPYEPLWDLLWRPGRVWCSGTSPYFQNGTTIYQ